MLKSQRARKLGPEIDPLWLGSGWSLKDLGKPQILLENSSADHPGSRHLLSLVEQAKNEVYAGGGKPSIYTVSDICDGIATGHEGMNYSLISRDIIAAMVEIHAKANPFDAMIAFSSCDKAVPAHLMALAQIDLPGIHFCGGSMMPGPGYISAEKCYEINDLSPEKESKNKEYYKEYYKLNACPTKGACQYMGTASTMQVISESLGLALPGNALMPAWSNLLNHQAQKAGSQVIKLLEMGISTKDILTKEAIENAIVVHAAVAGSSNALIHLPAIAGIAGILLELSEFEELQRSIPVLVDCKTSGPWPTQLFWFAGGVPQIMLEIEEFLHLDALTVTGKTLGENLAQLKKENFFEETNSYLQNYGLTQGDIIKTIDNPIYEQGGLAVLTGNLAPKGSVVKQTAVDSKMLKHTGPARPFNSEKNAIEAIKSGRIKPGDVIIIRGQGPKGSGMPELLKTTEAIYNRPKLRCTTALITDGRFSGATRGPAIGHVSPECLSGGPIAIVEENDLIKIDIPERSLDIIEFNGGENSASFQEIFQKRFKKLKHEARDHQTNTGVSGLFTKTVGATEKGATIF